MTSLIIQGRLTAAEDRTLRGRLLPFGVPGFTNMGKVHASAGVLEYPQTADELAELEAYLDHQDERDTVADFAGITETEDGLDAVWNVKATHGGDKLLAEFRGGKRTGVSVEIEPVEIRDGNITAGKIVGCAFPVAPAFSTARLTAEAVDAPAPDTIPEETPPAAPDTTTPPASPTEGDTPVTTPSQATGQGTLTAAAAPSAPAAPKRLTAANATTMPEWARLMAEAHRTQDRRLLAALSDVIPSNIEPGTLPQWLGELWSGVAYNRRVTPLLAQAPLTGLKLKGWKWETKPVVGRYSGNKADVPSNEVSRVPVEDVAQRFAGAHDIDRAIKDFGDTEFWTSYYAAMTESYARDTDAFATEELKAGATTVTLGPVPSGIDPGWAALVDAALAVVPIGAPSFALVESSVYRSMILTPQDKFLEFLSAGLGLEEGQLSGFKIIPVSSTAVGTASAVGLDRGELIVGTKSAATWHELGGGAPIRVEAVDIARGGIDAGVFGYAGVVINDARGLVKADLTADV